ncbi:hypothetical protein [Bacillus sonorensis]|nr:hypothetical protein [Bacillus sonorensis]
MASATVRACFLNRKETNAAKGCQFIDLKEAPILAPLSNRWP